MRKRGFDPDPVPPRWRIELRRWWNILRYRILKMKQPEQF